MYTIPVEIKTQMCNSVTNICYKPASFKKTIQVTINSDKEIVSARSSSGVKWSMQYNDALDRAKKSGQNIFVLITAPAWCGYCKILDRDVIEKPKTIELLNKGFVPLKILDSSADQGRFNFDGYPTMILLDSNGKEITRNIGYKEDSFASSMSPYAKSSGNQPGPEPVRPPNQETGKVMNFKLSGSGKLEQKGSKWILSYQAGNAEVKNELVEVRRDESYIILSHQESGVFYAIPASGGKGFIFLQNVWVPYFDF